MIDIDQALREISNIGDSSSRTRKEMLECMHWSWKCSEIMTYYMKEIPFESWKNFMMEDGLTAYLPIELGALIKRDFCNPLDGYKLHMKNKVIFL